MSVLAEFFGGPEGGKQRMLQSAALELKCAKPPRINWSETIAFESIGLVHGWYRRVSYDVSRGIACYRWMGWEDGSE